MSRFMLIGGIIGFPSGIIALVLTQEWLMYVTAAGALIALPSIFEPKPEKERQINDD